MVPILAHVMLSEGICDGEMWYIIRKKYICKMFWSKNKICII
jgi:hypothetical protein